MLNNLTLADRYATLVERLRDLEAEVKAVRDLIIATGQERVQGDFADIVVALSERTTFDAKAAHKFLTPAQIAECTRSTVVTTLRVKPKLEA
jgi:hypothetical protein